MTRCGHAFCFLHLAKWLDVEEAEGKATTCPVCRERLNRTRDVTSVFIDASAQPTAEPRLDMRGAMETWLAQWEEMVTAKARLEARVEEQAGEIGQLRAEVERLRTLVASSRAESAPPVARAAAPRSRPEARPAAEVIARGAWRLQRTDTLHTEPVHSIDMHARCGLMATASWDRTCRVVDTTRDAVVATLVGHETGLYCVRFVPCHDALLATASGDWSAVLWNWKTGEQVHSFHDHFGEVNGIGVSTTGDVLATCSDDGKVILYDIPTCRVLTRLIGHRDVVYSTAFAPEPDVLASTSFDRSVLVWDWRANRMVASLHGHEDRVVGVDFSADGTLLASGSDDGTCLLWDRRTNRVLHELRDHTAEVKRLRFSPTGRFLASTSGDRRVLLFDCRDGDASQFAALQGHEDFTFDVAWDHEERFVVSASHDMTVRRWAPDAT